jgi:tRNA 2-selenouridine synthase
MVKQQCDEDDATRNHESDRDRTRDARPKAQQRSGPAPIPVNVAQLLDFDEVIDVRSEAEYAEDHIPGALNCPVLDNAERVLVGTIYKQRSSFDAKKIGAALVSANISRHLHERFQDRPREWKPLVYCWRGGGRSGALAHVLAQVGWRAGQLEGGYKAYRRAVMTDLERLPRDFRWRVVCGMTGTGKSRLLRALALRGAQVLDLEALAAHRGSILGNLPDEPQPTQKMFDSLVRHALARFDPDRPVFVEAESKKIGRLRVPEALIDSMWSSECLVLDAPIEVRVALLQSEYAHYIADPEALVAQIECLTALHGRETISRWQALSREGNSAACEELLVRHYDPAYTRSTLEHYPALAHAPRFEVRDASDAAFTRLAAEVAEHTLARV